LLICIGTSLKVAPVSEVIGFVKQTTPQIYISKTPVKHVDFDVTLLGDCDTVVAELCRRLQWELKHNMLPNGSSSFITAEFKELESSVYYQTTLLGSESETSQKELVHEA